ncbi:hypothetical protein J4481_01370 [Candidatus Pacearchaeota archaeon]|nr:hypothetical protein [Candidatus Pacearchaeota archaeon]
MENINQEILNQLNQIRIDINIIKQAVDDGELTDWAKNELVGARKVPDSEMVSLEDVEKMILEK